MTGPDVRRRWARVGLVLLALGVAGAFVVLTVVRDFDHAASIVQSAIAVVTAFAGAALWLLRRGRTPVADEVSATAVCDRIAAELLGRWERTAAERRLVNPAPIPVSWQASTRGISGPVSDAVGVGARFAPLPGLARITAADLDRGDLSALYGIYGGLDSGRLIITGAPGAGKTGAAIMLVLDALRRRAAVPDEARRAVPVPILTTLQGWDPRTVPVQRWLAQQLAEEFPVVRTVASAAETEQVFIRTGHFAFVLDGLDEMPEAVRAVAVRALDEQVTSSRVVLLTRTDEIIAVSHEAYLASAAVLEVGAVGSADAAGYLRRCRPVGPGPWTDLCDTVEHHPDGVLARAMATPLTLTLLRDTVTSPAEVAELLRPEAFATPAAVEEYLIDRVIPVAYRQRPGEPAPPYREEDAVRWLTGLARLMNQHETRDLAWWRVHEWVPRGPRIAATTITVAAILTLPLLLLILLINLLFYGFVSDGTGSLLYLIFGVTAVIALLVGLVFGVLYSGGRRSPRRWVRVRARDFVSKALLKTVLRATLVGVVVFGTPMLALLLLFPSDLGALPAQVALMLVITLGGGGISGLLGGLLFGLLGSSERRTIDTSLPEGPRASWRNDRTFGIVSGLMAGLWLTTLATTPAGLLTISGDDVSGSVGELIGTTVGTAITVSPVTGAAAIAVALVRTAVWPARLSFRQLRRRKVAPRNLMNFLEDARNRNVLRTIGPVYQFRHATLQDRLAPATVAPAAAMRDTPPPQHIPGLDLTLRTVAPS